MEIVNGRVADVVTPIERDLLTVIDEVEELTSYSEINRVRVNRILTHLEQALGSLRSLKMR